MAQKKRKKQPKKLRDKFMVGVVFGLHRLFFYVGIVWEKRILNILSFVQILSGAAGNIEKIPVIKHPKIVFPVLNNGKRMTAAIEFNRHHAKH